MNIKSKQGLALLDAILADTTWEKHGYTLEDLFHKVDIDYINHLISTEINGMEVIDEYDELLQDEILLKELDIIQNNISKFFI